MMETLLASPKPAIRWKALGSPDTPELREQIRSSAIVRRMLAPLRSGRLPAYATWQGAHWVLGALAELGYPPGDPAAGRL